MPNRLKPYLLILFVIWPLFTILFSFAGFEQALDAQKRIGDSIHVTGNVERATHLKNRKGSSSYWVYVSIPQTKGRTQCDGPISSQTYSAIESRTINQIAVYVGNDGSCWTVEDRDRRASKISIDHWFMGAVFALGPAFFAYFLIAMIPFGKTRQSLNRRWAARKNIAS